MHAERKRITAGNTSSISCDIEAAQRSRIWVSPTQISPAFGHWVKEKRWTDVIKQKNKQKKIAGVEEGKEKKKEEGESKFFLNAPEVQTGRQRKKGESKGR